MSAKVTDHSFAMRCVPFASPAQRVLSQLTAVIPHCPLSESIDAFGNVVLAGYVGRRHDMFAYEASGLVQTGGPVAPEAASPLYLYPSQLTIPSRELTEAVRSLGATADSVEWVERLMDLLSRQIEYCSGVTSVSTSAADTWELRRGVCQDFAHVAIALCRLAGIPARYVCGLMTGEGATHAWVEFHDGTRWRAFDPTNHAWVGETYIKMAHGRDYSDCSISRGSFRGVAEQTINVSVDVWPVSPREVESDFVI